MVIDIGEAAQSGLWLKPEEYEQARLELERIQCVVEGRQRAAEFTTVAKCDSYLKWVLTGIDDDPAPQVPGGAIAVPSHASNEYADIETSRSPLDVWEAYKATKERREYLVRNVRPI